MLSPNTFADVPCEPAVRQHLTSILKMNEICKFFLCSEVILRQCSQIDTRKMFRLDFLLHNRNVLWETSTFYIFYLFLISNIIKLFRSTSSFKNHKFWLLIFFIQSLALFPDDTGGLKRLKSFLQAEESLLNYLSHTHLLRDTKSS